MAMGSNYYMPPKPKASDMNASYAWRTQTLTIHIKVHVLGQTIGIDTQTVLDKICAVITHQWYKYLTRKESIITHSDQYFMP